MGGLVCPKKRSTKFFSNDKTIPHPPLHPRSTNPQLAKVKSHRGSLAGCQRGHGPRKTKLVDSYFWKGFKPPTSQHLYKDVNVFVVHISYSICSRYEIPKKLSARLKTGSSTRQLNTEPPKGATVIRWPCTSRPIGVPPAGRLRPVESSRRAR